MRWNSKPTETAKIGETKTEWLFLFIPKLLQGQWRWMEWANVEYVYRQHIGIIPEVGTYDTVSWCAIKWADSNRT